jgi:hypothetical protein
MRVLAAVLCLFVVTACYQESPTRPGPIDQEMTLGPGQTAAIERKNLSLRFDGVTGDSRCPADALCILGGSATVKLTVTGRSGASREIRFETGLLKAVAHDSITLELVQLAPYPFSATPIRHEDYRATIRVKR